MANNNRPALDRRIDILAPIANSSDFNEPVETFELFATVWATKRDASAAEAYRAQEVGAQITARFTVRWSEEIALVDPRYRLSFAGKVYNITGIREVERNRWIEVDAVARAESGQTEEAGSP